LVSIIPIALLLIVFPFVEGLFSRRLRGLSWEFVDDADDQSIYRGFARKVTRDTGAECDEHHFTGPCTQLVKCDQLAVSADLAEFKQRPGRKAVCTFRRPQWVEHGCLNHDARSITTRCLRAPSRASGVRMARGPSTRR